MKNLVIFIFLFMSSFAFAQIKITEEEEIPYEEAPYEEDEEEVDQITTFELFYGQHVYYPNNFTSINRFDFYKYSNPIHSVGFRTGAVIQTFNVIEYAFNMGYTQIIPQRIMVNDSLQGRINGCHFSLNYLGFDITPNSSYASILFGTGINFGRLRISTNAFKAQKNPFFAPTFYFNPRFFIGKFIIGLKAEYQFDISKRNWRSVLISQKEKGFNVESLRQTGLFFNLSLGIRIE